MQVLTLLVTVLFAVTYGKFPERIVGGNETDIKNVPYQLSLIIDDRHECGASIISKNWALTAAHCCVEDFPLSLRAGSSTREIGGTVHDVQTIVVHPRFETDPYNENDYDYALLEVKIPFKIGTAKVDKICLTNVEPIKGLKCIVSGWGLLSLRDKPFLPGKLHSVEVPIIDRTICKKAYKGLENITNRMICAGCMNTGGKDACQNDSGGPMVSKGKQVGIVSWGIGCGNPKYPGVYSNVAAQRAWIRKHTGV